MVDHLALKLTAQGIDTSTLQTVDEVFADYVKNVNKATVVENRNPIYTLAAKGDDILVLWQRLSSLSNEFGYSAVILGDKDSLNHHWQLHEGDWSPTSYLETADKCDAETWFQTQWQEFFELDEEFSEADIRESSPRQVKPYTKLGISHLYATPASIQYIGLLPTTVNTDLPAFLRFGNWNNCPSPDEHVCVHRYWHRKYQTQIVAMLFDTIICRVGAPVKDFESALKLARQYMAYCEDSVFQGTGTLDVLAASLINSTYWSFWWD